MNADAVVYSIGRVIDSEFNSEQISFFSTIKDARATGDLTLHVINDGPNPILPTRPDSRLLELLILPVPLTNHCAKIYTSFRTVLEK